MNLVIIESPYAGTPEEVERNVTYARRCLRHSLLQGESPFASHLLYTQDGVLDDKKYKERRIGIQAGLEWGVHANITAVYFDYGVTGGMLEGIGRALQEGRIVAFRTIGKNNSET